MDGEHGRCLRFAHHVLCHAGVGAYISWGQTTDLQGVVLTNLISWLKQVFMYQMLSNTKKTFLYTDQLNATCVSWQHRQKRAVDQTKAERGWGRKVLCDERGPDDESYLPLGRSPSSFLQRTVGTGSPRASHLNSTLWSTNTTWLPGRRTKLGRSALMKKAHKWNITEHRIIVVE